MSKKFFAVNRRTGEKWKPSKKNVEKEYLVMYDSGYLAVVTVDFYIHIEPLSRKDWEVVLKE